MLKRLLLPALLTAGLGWSFSLAAGSLPTGARFDEPVSVGMNAGGTPLRTLLEALAASVKLSVVADGIPDKAMTFRLDGKPFREIWNLLITTNGLDFELLPNDIVIVGPPSFVSLARTPITSSSTTPSVVRRSYVVRTDAGVLASFLAKLVPGAAITPFPNGRMMFVDGTQAQQAQISDLLAQVDQAVVTSPSGAPSVRRTYSVKGDPGTLQSFLSKMLPSAVTNYAPNTKVLFVDATEAEQNQISSLLATVDQDTPSQAAVPTKRVSYSVRSDVAAVTAFLQRAVPNATFLPLPSNKLLYVDATADQQTQIKDLLAQIDQAPAPAALVTRTYPITGDASATQAFLAKLAPSATVVPTPDNHGLVVQATVEQQDQVSLLLAQTGPAPTAPAPSQRVSYAIKGDVSSIVSFLSRAISAANIIPGPNGAKVIYVDAAAAQQTQVKDLLAQVDQASAPASIITRAYLITTDPAATQAFLNRLVPGAQITPAPNGRTLVVQGTEEQQGQVKQLLEQTMPTTTAATPAARASYSIKTDVGSIVIFLQKALPNASIIPGPNNAKVIYVDATVADQAQVRLLLDQVDMTAAAPSAVNPTVRRTFTFKSDPAAIQGFLVKLVPGAVFNVAPGTRLLYVDATEAEQAQVSALLAQVDQDTPVASTVPIERRSYTIKTDIAAVREFLAKTVPGATTNSVTGTSLLVVDGTPAQLSEVERLLKLADQAPPPSPTGPMVSFKIFTLSNAKAVVLADVLTKAVQGATVSTNQSQSTTTTVTTLPTATPATPPNGASPNLGVLKFTADEISNSLIVSGTADQIAQIEALLPQLDRRQSLVNVGVRIQEVSDAAGRNLGINWNFGVGNFAGKILDTGLSFLFDATKSLAGLNIGATLDALESQNLSRRINDSTITVVNNGTGSLSSGGRIELSIPGTPPISKTLNFGVLVQVTPLVSPDGTITLGVKAEVSDVANKQSVDPSRIDFTNRAASTTVALRDGQTLLLGSLLQTTSDSKTTGVPILSAIPLIGELFKSRSTSDSQTQLLIVLTANIVK